MRIISRLVQRVRLGVSEFLRSYIRFVDTASVTWSVVDDPTNDEIEVSATATGGGSGYTTVQDEGTPLTQRSTVDFVGAGVTATDTGSKTQVSIPGGAGTPASTVVSEVGVDQDPAVGGDTNFAREGHTHGSMEYGALVAFGG